MACGIVQYLFPFKDFFGYTLLQCSSWGKWRGKEGNASIISGLCRDRSEKSREGGGGGGEVRTKQRNEQKRKEKENSVILQTPKPKGYALDLQRKSLSRRKWLNW